MFDKQRPNFIVSISGGAGKNILFTSTAKAISKVNTTHNLVVISPYPELLINLPFIDRVYKADSIPYLYEDLIGTNPSSASFAVEPYHHSNYLNEREHLSNTWLRMLGVEPKELIQPEIKLTFREKEQFLNNHRESLLNYTKPILVIQPFGGSGARPYNWCRDIPLSQAQQLVDILSTNFLVVQINRPGQFKLNNCIQFTGGSLREVACLIAISSKRLLIDSFGQHCAAALNLPSTVCWVTNKPIVFGYDIHKNIIAPKGINHQTISRIDSVFQLENWEGTLDHYYPYENDQVFNVDEIVESIYQN